MSSSGEMISRYLAHLERAGYSKATLEANRRWLEHLANGAKDLAELGPADLTAFEKVLRWQPNERGQMYSENSVNQAVDVIRRFYRWAAEVGHVRKNPSSHMKTRRVPAKRKHELSTTDARKLLGQPNPKTFHGTRDRAILGLIIEHRLAFEVLAALDCGSFHYDTGAVMAGGRRRGVVSLSEGLTEDLQSYLVEARPGVAKVEESALFVGRDGTRMTAASFRSIVDRHARAAGLSKACFSS